MFISTPLSVQATAHTEDLAEASQLFTISKFYNLLEHSKALIGLYGPYTTHPNTTVFTRAARPTSQPCGPSSRCMAISLAAAQDSIGSAQETGPAKDDLRVFKHLWDATVDVLEEVLSTGDLDHESFGWGIWGLCAGYMCPPSEASYEVFIEQKHRLHEALLALPTKAASTQRNSEGVKGEGRVEFLAKANRQAHICASLVLQRFRQEGWHRIRWWHGVKVAERWIARLGLTEGTKLAGGRVGEKQPSGSFRIIQ